MTRPHRPFQVASIGQQPLSRRRLLQGLGVGGSVAVFPGLAACGRDDDDGGAGEASGAGETATVGSNYSDEVPKEALQNVFDAFTKTEGVEVDLNTVEHEQYQENINAYLQSGPPQDVWAWFAGYRMQFFAERGFAGDLSGLWSESLDDQFTEAFKQASTGLDGNQYFVPFYTYPWAVFYRKSLFDEKGYTIPTTLDDYVALCQEMESGGLIPLGLADKEGWPAMGTFDVINFRTNGYDFHMSLMAGEESWESDEVKQTFSTWRDLMPYYQPDSLGRDWLDSAADLLNKRIGMYYHNTSVGQAFMNKADREDLDFFAFPTINEEFGQDTIEAPIDGWMMGPQPKDEAAALALLEYIGSPEGQATYLAGDPNYIAANSNADTSTYDHLQKKSVEVIGGATNITQFLDRDTRPDFASTVMISALQDFIENPDDIDGLTASIEEQKQSIFG